MKPKIQRCCGAMHEPSTHARVCLPGGSSAVSMALKFLHKKGWHPATLENQRRKWIAEQKVWSPQQNGVAASRARMCSHPYHAQTKARKQGEVEAAMEIKRAAEELEQRQVGRWPRRLGRWWHCPNDAGRVCHVCRVHRCWLARTEKARWLRRR